MNAKGVFGILYVILVLVQPSPLGLRWFREDKHYTIETLFKYD